VPAEIRRAESSRWSKSTKPPRMWRTPCTCRVDNSVEAQGLIHRVQRWSALHQKQLLLGRAKQDAESLAMSLTAAHNALGIADHSGKARVAQTNAQAESGTAAGGSRKPSNLNREGIDHPGEGHQAARFRAKTLAGFGKRIDDQNNWPTCMQMDGCPCRQAAVGHSPNVDWAGHYFWDFAGRNLFR